MRNFLVRALLAVKGVPTQDDELNSLRLRKKFKDTYDIDVGLYSYGCFDSKRINPKTTIGRYCSFATSVHIFNRNHGLNYIGTNAYLYNPKLMVVDRQMIGFEKCTIDDDVWVGHNAIIVPSAKHIGRGAVVAAGAVVTKNVPPYAIVAGNPAKVIGYRFSLYEIEKIEESKWWEMTPQEIRAEININSEFFFHPKLFFNRNR